MKVLEDYNIISIKRERDTVTKRQKNNVYLLLDKDIWAKPNVRVQHVHTEPGESNDISRVNQLHSNYTHINNTKKEFSKKENSLPSKEVKELKEVRLDAGGTEVEVSSRNKADPRTKRINLAFRDLCEKHINEKPPFALGKQGAIIKSALTILSEEDILDLFEWWFEEPQAGKQDYDLIQITQALSGYNISKYRIEHGK